MDAIEAMIYCLGYVGDKPEDGEYASQKAFDKNGEAHWFAWRANNNKAAYPRPCSGSPAPFAKYLEPYSINTRGHA
jgi:hypothetical protein